MSLFWWPWCSFILDGYFFFYHGLASLYVRLVCVVICHPLLLQCLLLHYQVYHNGMESTVRCIHTLEKSLHILKKDQSFMCVLLHIPEFMLLNLVEGVIKLREMSNVYDWALSMFPATTSQLRFLLLLQVSMYTYAERVWPTHKLCQSKVMMMMMVHFSSARCKTFSSFLSWWFSLSTWTLNNIIISECWVYDQYLQYHLSTSLTHNVQNTQTSNTFYPSLSPQLSALLIIQFSLYHWTSIHFL